MSKSGPVVIIEDDPDDQEMISRILTKMNIDNPIRKFNDGEEALRYLRLTKEKPFVIICDINMPVMNGLQLKKEMDNDADLRVKNIPFVYLSTTANPEQVMHAYSMTVQGFFVKGQSYEVLKHALEKIIEYWQTCIFPNSL
ncbi:MAG TPA: response regulator [Chryseosolibacter sp.]|nr:response regulator [Chryseosolibacter sp.]